MILFYKKKTGEVFATIHGRVHSKGQMKCFIGDGTPEKDIGKLIIGWEETGKYKVVEEEIEELKEIKKNLFTKVKVKVPRQKPINKEHNLKQFKLLQKFEDNSPENPLDYKVKKGKLIKKF